VQSEVTTRVRIRYRPGVTPAMRLVHGADFHIITAVIHVNSARNELQLMCKLAG
jgi:head-tail adaptor